MVANLLIWIISIILIGLLAFIEGKRLILSKRFKHIPGVPELPLAGSFYTFRSNHFSEISILFDEICCAPVAKLFIGSKMIFFISDPEVMQAVLTGTNFTERPFWFSFFRLPYGIITSKYHEWKPIRKALNPAYSQRMTLSFIPTFEKHFKSFCNEIEKHIGGGETFNINEISVKTGIKVILDTNFGYETNEFDGHVFEQFEENICQRIASPTLYPDFLYKRSKLGKSDQEVDQSMAKIFRDVLQKRELQLQAQSKVGKGRLFIDEIQRYVKENSFENDDVLIQNMVTVFIAGYETAALTLSMAILLLAMHPEIDAKLEQELMEHYEPGQPIDQELLRKLTYLDQVVRETLRLYPPAPITARQNIEDTHIDKIGHIEKNSILVLSFYNLHRWKHVWGDDADKFNPDHFSAENVAKRHPYAFLPFSGGAKVCIGYQYALTNVKVGLVSILSRYKFSTDLKMKDFEYIFSVTLKMANKYLVKAQPRIWDNSTQ